MDNSKINVEDGRRLNSPKFSDTNPFLLGSHATLLPQTSRDKRSENTLSMNNQSFGEPKTVEKKKKVIKAVERLDYALRKGFKAPGLQYKKKNSCASRSIMSKTTKAQKVFNCNAQNKAQICKVEVKIKSLKKRAQSTSKHRSAGKHSVSAVRGGRSMDEFNQLWGIRGNLQNALGVIDSKLSEFIGVK